MGFVGMKGSDVVLSSNWERRYDGDAVSESVSESLEHDAVAIISGEGARDRFGMRGDAAAVDSSEDKG